MKKTILLMILVLALAACNGAPAQDAAPEMEEEPEQEQQEPEEAPDEAPEAESESDLLDYFERKQSIEFQVTYNMVSEQQGQTLNTEMTQYFKDGKIRMDMTAQGMEIQSYVLEDRYVSCFQMQGWQCQEVPTDSYDQDPYRAVEEDMVQGDADYDHVRRSDRQIAGTTAKCFGVTVEEGEVEYCFSEEGVPLYVKTDAQGVTSELTATDYSTSVEDGVFVPPN